MTVAELIEELKKLPPDSEVIISKDAEGNSYSPLYSVCGDAIYKPSSLWRGDITWSELSADDMCCSSNEQWEAFKASSRRCCVLEPIN
jgi:hypothetical protein